MAIKLSSKRLQIDKANTTIVIVVSIAAFVTIFSVFAAKSLLAQHAYQARVIKRKQIAEKTLSDDLKATDSLVASYKSFIQAPINVIGGSTSGTGDNSGDNAKIILDSLPSKYDFPALASSIEKILTNGAYKINSISGTDDLLSQSNILSGTPSQVPMPIEITVEANYQAIQNLVTVFEKSIRPFQAQTMTLSGNNQTMKLNLKQLTYYQPGKTLNVKTEVIK
ncbi:MAG: hypothetical protein NVS1B7_2620 [Candidatus Saccharimonadales bacterium]